MGGMCKFGILLAYLLMLSNIHTSRSVSLDLTELRNKVSKIKVNPRGNLWATGHFMGKKSISDNQLQDLPSFAHFKMKRVQTPTKDVHQADEILKELITEELLKVAFQVELKDPPDSVSQDKDFVIKLLKMTKRKR